MRNAGLEETQAGIKIAGRNINNLRYADDITLMAESEEELKHLLMKVKEESEKVGLKLNIQKMKIMASGPITSQENRWENSGNSVRLYFWGLQNHCRWWPQQWNEKMLAPWKKSYDKPIQCIKKLRHYFDNKNPYSQSYGFSSSRGCESWTIKKAECRRTDAFELWCRRRLLRVPWTARRSNQSILKEISPEYSLEGLVQNW